MTINFEQNIGEQLKFAFEHNEEISKADTEEIILDSGYDYTLGNGRWYAHVVTLFECGDFYYGLKHDRGLTECQEDEYWAQVPCKFKRISVISYEYEEIHDDQSANP